MDAGRSPLGTLLCMRNRMPAPPEEPDARAERARRRSKGRTASGRPLADEFQTQHRSTPEENHAARIRILEAMATEHELHKTVDGVPYRNLIPNSGYASLLI